MEKSHSLKKLRLSTTCIEVIEGLEHLTSLEELDLHHNKIKKIEGLDALVKLQELDLSENEIEEVDAQSLSNISSPCIIYLGGNPIKKLNGAIPNHIKIL